MINSNNNKYTLVMVWATNCHLCEEQKPMIQTFHSDYKDTAANVVGIAIDGIGNPNGNALAVAIGVITREQLD